MFDILSFFTFRTVILLFSTTFSIFAVMMMLNIVTVDDLVTILKLSPESESAVRLIFGRFQEVSGNVIDILSQLLNKLFGWAGTDIDLSKIDVDVNQEQPSANSTKE
jgi:hypothetical protein